MGNSTDWAWSESDGGFKNTTGTIIKITNAGTNIGTSVVPLKTENFEYDLNYNYDSAYIKIKIEIVTS